METIMIFWEMYKHDLGQMIVLMHHDDMAEIIFLSLYYKWKEFIKIIFNWSKPPRPL
jgi:hypothetical protein